jgi:hypothetical protein
MLSKYPHAVAVAAVKATTLRITMAVASISSLSLWEMKVATHKPPGLQKPLCEGVVAECYCKIKYYRGRWLLFSSEK